MSRSAGTQTQTTVSQPPSYLLPYLQQGAGAAADMYNSGGPQVVPFAPQTQQALGMTEQRALTGSPVTRAAQDYATQGLTGGLMGRNPFLASGPNPYLDATFNQAAQSTQNQLTSEFSRSGRNVGAREPFRAEQLNNLATQIYGGAYDADASRRLSAYQGERNLQQGLVPLAGQLANQDYADIGQLATVGSQYEGLQREYQNQPGANLDAYLARLQGFPGGTVTSSIPTQRNRLGELLGGGLMGLGATSGLLGTAGGTGLAALGLTNPIGWGILGGSALLGMM